MAAITHFNATVVGSCDVINMWSYNLATYKQYRNKSTLAVALALPGVWLPHVESSKVRKY